MDKMYKNIMNGNIITIELDRFTKANGIHMGIGVSEKVFESSRKYVFFNHINKRGTCLVIDLNEVDSVTETLQTCKEHLVRELKLTESFSGYVDTDIASMYPTVELKDESSLYPSNMNKELFLCMPRHAGNTAARIKSLYLEAMRGDLKRKHELSIKKVIFNDPATIVIWKDGTKTIVKCQDGDVFDPEKGLAMAISKRVLGDKGAYYDEFKKWLPVGHISDCRECEYDNTLGCNEPCASCSSVANGPYDNFKPKTSKVSENKVNVECITGKTCLICKHYNVNPAHEPCRSCGAWSKFEPGTR